MRGGRLQTAVLAWCIGAATSAAAGSFAVNPVRVTLTADRTAAALTVRNNGTEPAVIQLEVASWSQPEGVDTLAPTRELLATPPIFTLPGGGSQIVRVGLRGRPPEAHQELSYRLVLKEIPPPPLPDARGLQMALHISLPVFVAPRAPAKPLLHWEASQGDGLRLSARNDGNVHVQVTGIRLADTDKPLQAAPGYVLPGQRHEWRVRNDAPVGAPLHLVAQTDAGEVSADMMVTAP